MVVAYDINDNWGTDTITVVSSDNANTNISPVEYKLIRIKKNMMMRNLWHRDNFILEGAVDEIVFHHFDVSDPDNPDSVSVIIRGRNVGGDTLIRAWDTNERKGETFWNRCVWKFVDKPRVKVKRTVRGVQINQAKEGRMSVKLKWKRGKKGRPAEARFKIRVLHQKIIGNQTDNTDALDLTEPCDIWMSIGNVQITSRVMFDEKTGRAILLD